MNMEMARRFVTLRKNHGYSQEELADKLGISRQAISKWERAESSPDTDNLIALSKLYRVSLDALLNLDNESIENEAYAMQQERHGTDAQTENDAPTKKASRWYYFPYPLVVVLAYYLLGSITGQWCFYLFVFLSIPIYYLTVNYFAWKEKKSRKKAKHPTK